MFADPTRDHSVVDRTQPLPSRRTFLHASGLSLIGSSLLAQEPGVRPSRDVDIQIENPRLRVPVAIIVDDSTCLVNLNKFAIPQFAAAWQGQRYAQDWRSMPDEIPDSFVRKFGEWAAESGVKGKYSIVPYPACVGRLDRVVPGWTRAEIDRSLKLVRELMLPRWDIHPEMVTHTWVINTQTGHPYPERTTRQMENWNWTDGRSEDELTDYLAYALRILKNVDLPCEGVTTPGGFGNRVLPALSRAAQAALRDVYQAEIPHYFRHAYSQGERSVAPRVEYAAALDSDDPRCVVSIVACTGDWTGGWDCSNRGDVNQFITEDLRGGRMVEIIERGEPAIMLCHWTGIYFNGEEVGLRIFQEAVRRLHRRFDHLYWMKLSEISRYWAARELTAISAQGNTYSFQAPFACPEFTMSLPHAVCRRLRWTQAQQAVDLREVASASQLSAGTYHRDGQRIVVCVDLPRGVSRLQVTL